MNELEKRQKQRIALSAYFLLSGICFSTWASRIPTIKDNFNLDENTLGNLLMVMPASAIIGIPLSGWLVSKFDNRIPLQIASFTFLLSLLFIGFAPSIWWVVLALVVFSVSLRVINITINTQSIAIQEKFEKKIVGTFHGIWSIGGILGVLFSTIMIKFKISIEWHLIMVAVLGILMILFAFHYLLRNDKARSGNGFRLGKPSKYISLLGLIVFFAAICEGGMYDWNGVYFKEVVKEEVFTYGYLLFMVCMTISRLTIDKMMEKFGMQKLYILGSFLIMIGVTMAVVFPYFWTALIGFCMVGFGVSGLYPMTYILAGRAKKYSVGIVISIVSTYSTIGMFLGPPIIGYLAHAFGLQRAFITFIVGGLMFIPLSKMVFNHLKNRD